MGFRLLGTDHGYWHLKQLERKEDVSGLIDALDAPAMRKAHRRRSAVAISLGKIGSAEAVPTLSEQLRSDPSALVRASAAKSLGGILSDGGLAALRAGLSDEDENVQIWSAYGLGRLRDSESVEQLIGFLHAPDAGRRSYAARALGEIGDERALGPLTEQLSDEDASVQEAARHALQELSPYDRRG